VQERFWIGLENVIEILIWTNTNMKEKRTIEIEAYRDSEGNPCCAKDFTLGQVCPFYMTYTMGSGETCYFLDYGVGKPLPLFRRKDGEGTLIPHSNCPIWNKENE